MSKSVKLSFQTGAENISDLELVGIRGTERISELYQIELVLSCKSLLTETQQKTLLQSPCAIGIGAAERQGKLHGILADLRAVDLSMNSPALYRGRLVPTVGLLDLATTCCVHADSDLVKLITSILKRWGLGTNKGKDKDKDGDNDFTIDVGWAPVAKASRVQYEESDWQFVQRWLERSGGHYAFEQGAKRETLLISNDIGSLCSTSTAGAAGDAATASGADSAAAAAKSCVDLYDRKANTSSSAWTAWDVSKEVSRTPKRVAIDAYTPNPSLSLACEKEIGASVSGFGTLFRYDEDHTSAATGETLVKLLAQRELSEHVLIRGCTDCTTLRAGQIFTLKDVPNHADADYLVLGLELEAGEPIDGSFSATQDRGGHPAAAQGDKARAFVARFTAVPASVSHRPRLKTPRPSIQGLVRGFIDDDGTNTTKLYKQGCYSVVVPFDTNFRTKSRVARTMPMVRGYLGPGHGQRLPLRKGAEVMIAHIDGDPDRPVIVGAVMNEHITGPPAVFNEPALETESGIRIEFDDQQS